MVGVVQNINILDPENPFKVVIDGERACEG
jgi:hypothetical protein